MDEQLLTYIRSGHDLETLSNLSPRTALEIRRRGSYYMVHPTLEGWLLDFKKIRRQHPRWLVCPPLAYRWDLIAMFHDVLGHSSVTQTLIVVHQHFHWVKD